MRPRRYKMKQDDAFAWHCLLKRDVIPALKSELLEVPRGCTAKPPNIYRVLMIHGLLQQVEDIMIQLQRQWEQP